RAYGVTRAFHHDISQSNFAVSQSPMVSYDTDENARLFSYYQYNSGSFLNFSTGSNDWRNVIASASTHDMTDIAFVYPFGTSANKLAALDAWKNKTSASINGGYIDYSAGSPRETSYYSNNKAQLLNGVTSGDDQAIVPQVLRLTADHFNCAASAVNHSRGT